MKNILTLGFFIICTLHYSQVAIGKASVSNTTSVSLEFGNTAAKGLLLPWVTNETAVTGAVPGTMIYDLSDKKVKYYKYDESKSSNVWFDLSVDGSGAANDSAQNALIENPSAKTSIGTPKTPDVPGILVLEDDNKAMVLPLVDKYSSIVNPSPGMMVFDTTNNMLCVFNGTNWSFWKN